MPDHLEGESNKRHVDGMEHPWLVVTEFLAGLLLVPFTVLKFNSRNSNLSFWDIASFREWIPRPQIPFSRALDQKAKENLRFPGAPTW